MRILLDENIPVGFAGLLQGHDVLTVRGLGWSILKKTVHSCNGRVASVMYL